MYIDFDIGKMIILQVKKYGSIWNQCFLFWDNNYSAITQISESVTTIVMFSLLHRGRGLQSVNYKTNITIKAPTSMATYFSYPMIFAMAAMVGLSPLMI